jgi:signal transduction histidine kinase
MAEPMQRDGRPARWRRALLAGWPPPPGDAGAPRDRLTDWVLFAFAAGLGAVALGTLWHTHGAVLDWLDVAAGVLACLAVWARWSVLALAVMFAASAFSPLALGAGLVAICSAASRVTGRALIALAAVVVAGSFVFLRINPAAGEVQRVAVPAIVFAAMAFGWGLYLRARRELVASLRERAKQLEADKERGAELAREAERRRIAREMHDVLAHRLSLLSVHAGALEFRPGAPAGEIAQAAAVIRTSAAAALADLRQVITVLREDSGDGTGPPQPAFSQLPALLAESRSAGMALQAHIDVPDAESLPAVVGRTVYRVVQEGLTNARRHAPGAAVDVQVTTDGRAGLVAEVVSHPAAGAPAPAVPSAAGAGVGLIGLAERVALAGGELRHETTAAGDFVLRATVPGAP